MESKSRNQYLVAIFASGSMYAGGLSYGWISQAYAQLVADDHGMCSYDFCVTTSQMAWIASLFGLGAIFLGFIAGPLMSKLGRTRAIASCMSLSITGWIFLAFPSSTLMLYLGRICVGGGFGGACVILPIYIGEIADTGIRGKLLSIVQVSLQLGVLSSYVLGYFFKIHIQNIASLTIVVFFSLTGAFLPESPRYYVYVNQIENAKQSLKLLYGVNCQPEVRIADMIDFQYTQLSRKLKTLFTKKVNLKALVVTLGLIIGVQMCESSEIMFYATDIFKDAKINIEPKLIPIYVETISLLAALLSLLLVDIVGRRPLLILSCLIMFLCSMIMGINYYYHISDPQPLESLSIIPVVTLCLYLFANMIGLSPISFILIGEMFAQNVKDLASVISMVCRFGFAGLFVLMQQSLAGTIINGVSIFMFAIFPAITCIFVMCAVPETKGKSFQEIQTVISREIFV